MSPSELWDLGCYEISLGDTIGVGTPRAARAMLQAVASGIRFRKARHALPRYLRPGAGHHAGLEEGVRVVDIRLAGWEAAPMRRAPPATSRPRMWSICSMALALNWAWIGAQLSRSNPVYLRCSRENRPGATASLKLSLARP